MNITATDTGYLILDQDLTRTYLEIRNVANFECSGANKNRGAHAPISPSYFTDPAVRPLTMYRSSRMPMIRRGAIAAQVSAAIVHHLTPWDVT